MVDPAEVVNLIGLRIVPLPTGNEKAEAEPKVFPKYPDVLSTLICLSADALAMEPLLPIVKVLAPVVMSAATFRFNSPFTVASPLIVKPLVLLFLRLKNVAAVIA